MRRLALTAYSFIFLSSIAAPVYALEKVVILGLFKEKAIIEVDGKRRTLATGETSPEGVTLLSANSNEAVLSIDGKTATYTLGTHISTTFTPPTGQKTVTIAPDPEGMYAVNGAINDFQVSFVVDTGASLIAMNKHQAKRLGLEYKLKGTESVSSTASGLSRIFIVTLKKVSIGDIQLQDIPAAVHDGDFPQVILLGNSFLSRVDIKREGDLLELQQK